MDPALFPVRMSQEASCACIGPMRTIVAGMDRLGIENIGLQGGQLRLGAVEEIWCKEEDIDASKSLRRYKLNAQP